MENTIQGDDTPKKLVERSAAYPALPLQNAIKFTESITKHFTDKQVVTREDVAAVLGRSVGNIQRDIAACGHYGLLLRQKEGYQISTLYKEIQNFYDETDLQRNLIEAFKKPKLYQDLIEKYNEHAVPPELRTHLIRFHGITEKSAAAAAETFLDSARFCKVLNEHNILNVEGFSASPIKDVEDAKIVQDKPLEYVQLPPDNPLKLINPPDEMMGTKN